jgi:hypothetical protein
MSHKKNQNSKNLPGQQQNPPAAQPKAKKQNAPVQQLPKIEVPAPIPRPIPEVIFKEFGKYVTDRNPVAFKIESTLETGKYELYAIDEAHEKHHVSSAPTFDLASQMLRLCQDICNDNLGDSSHNAHYINTFISGLWDALLVKCGQTPVDRVSFENLQYDAQRAKNLVASLRKEPLVNFGSYSCTRHSIKSFELIEKDAVWFLVARDISGSSHVCEMGGPQSQEFLLKKKAEYVKLANQQLIDDNLRIQWASRVIEPESPKKLDAASSALHAHEMKDTSGQPASSAPKKKMKRVMKKRVKPSKRENNDDDDDDIDRDDKKVEYEEYSDYEEDGFVSEIPSRFVEDQPQKKDAGASATSATKPAAAATPTTAEKFVQKQPPAHSNLAASRFLLGEDAEGDEDADDDGEDASFIRLLDPSALKEEENGDEDGAVHDGKLTLNKPTEAAGIKAADFAMSTGTVLPDGRVEVNGVKPNKE